MSKLTKPGMAKKAALKKSWISRKLIRNSRQVEPFDPPAVHESQISFIRPRILKLIRFKFPQVLLAVGGWSFGTQMFKDMASNSYNRRLFVFSAIEFLRKRWAWRIRKSVKHLRMIQLSANNNWATIWNRFRVAETLTGWMWTGNSLEGKKTKTISSNSWKISEKLSRWANSVEAYPTSEATWRDLPYHYANVSPLNRNPQRSLDFFSRRKQKKRSWSVCCSPLLSLPAPKPSKAVTMFPP